MWCCCGDVWHTCYLRLVDTILFCKKISYEAYYITHEVEIHKHSTASCCMCRNA